MTSKPGKQTITIHILSNISRCKGYQTITFGQLIQYNVRNIFFKKNHTQNVVEKPFPNPFLKNQNRAYLWITYVQVVFIACQVQGYRSILKLSCWPLAFTSYKAFFKKNKKSSRTSLPASFRHDFWRKLLILLYSINWPNFIVYLPLLLLFVNHVMTP